MTATPNDEDALEPLSVDISPTPLVRDGESFTVGVNSDYAVISIYLGGKLCAEFEAESEGDISISGNMPAGAAIVGRMTVVADYGIDLAQSSVKIKRVIF